MRYVKVVDFSRNRSCDCWSRGKAGQMLVAQCLCAWYPSALFVLRNVCAGFSWIKGVVIIVSMKEKKENLLVKGLLKESARIVAYNESRNSRRQLET